MDCRNCEKHINEYLDGELSKREEEKFLKHLEKCPTCKKEFEAYRFMTDQLDAMEELTPSEGFEARVLSQLQPYEAYEKRYTEKLTEEVQQRNKLKDVIMVLAYFITLFVVLNVLRNAVFQNTQWISGIMVMGRVFREVFDGLIFRGVLSLFVVYPIRIFHWARVNFSQMSVGGRMMYSLVVMNLILVVTFSQIMLNKLAKGRGKNKGGSSDEMQHSRM